MQELKDLVSKRVTLTLPIEGYVCRHHSGGFCVQSSDECYPIMDAYNLTVLPDLPEYWPPQNGDVWIAFGHPFEVDITDYFEENEAKLRGHLFKTIGMAEVILTDDEFLQRYPDTKLIYRPGVKE